MKKVSYKNILYHGVMGSLVVIGMRLLKYKFTMKTFQNDFVSEFILGTLVFITLGLLMPMDSGKKQEQ